MRGTMNPSTFAAATKQRRDRMNWRRIGLAAIYIAISLAVIALFVLVMSWVPPHAGS
jgi:hypothetical protein